MRRHLTYSNVISTLCLILILGGGAAYAADTIGSSDVIDNSLLSADLKNNQAVKSTDVQSESLTGADIADQSGVDTCVQTTRIGPLCVRAENQTRTWQDAVHHCANLDLHLPSYAEALELAKTHDIPNVDETEIFWTEELIPDPGSGLAALVEDDAPTQAGLSSSPINQARETVCVMTPTN